MLEIGTAVLDSLFCGLADWSYAGRCDGPACLACLRWRVFAMQGLVEFHLNHCNCSFELGGETPIFVS